MIQSLLVLELGLESRVGVGAGLGRKSISSRVGFIAALDFGFRFWRMSRITLELN